MVIAPPNVTVSITWTGPIPSNAFVSSSNSLVFVQPMGGEFICYAQGGSASINIIYNVALRGKEEERDGEEGEGWGGGRGMESRGEGWGGGEKDGEEGRRMGGGEDGEEGRRMGRRVVAIMY